jgi:polar amino acid transport system substrate-binding protein
MIIKKLSFYLLAISCFFSFSSHSYDLKIATGNDYAPYADDKLPNGGLSITLIKAMYEGSEQVVKLSFLPWERSYQLTYDLNYQITVPWIKTQERLEKFNYTEPLISIEQKIFSRTKDRENFKTIKDLKGKKICLPLGWATAGTEIDLMLKNKEIGIERTKDISSCVEMLAYNRADFFITDVFQGKTTIIKENLSEKITDTFTFSSVDLYAIVSKKNPNSDEIINTFNLKLKELKASEKYNEIINSFLKK